jgi:TetR/AcrR family transcriptional regulator, transcriptional repressor for nem operon
MEATGLEKGGIYRHFDSKQQLAAAAFDHAWKLAIDARFDGTDKIQNAIDRLKQIVRNFRDRRAGLVPGGCPLLNTAVDSDDGNPQLRAKARQALSLWLHRIEEISERGKQRGEVRSGVESADLAMLIVSTLEGGMMMRRLQKSDSALDLVCRHLENYLEANVRAPQPRKNARRS